MSSVPFAVVTESGTPPFPASHFLGALLQANSCARQLRVFCFLGSSPNTMGPSQNAAARLGSRSPRLWVPQENGAEKGENVLPQLSNSRRIRWSRSGAAPSEEQRYKVHRLSVATQRSWKNTQDECASKTEWHRVCVFRPQLAERVATAIKKGSHVLVEG